MEKQIIRCIAVLCSLAISGGLALNYELGKTYKYNYAIQLQISEGKDDSLGTVGLKITTQADAAVVWQHGEDKLLQFTLHDTKLFNATKREENENTYLSQPPTLQVVSPLSVFAHWNSGKITNLFVSSADSTSSLNVKKGVASLFQLQTSDGAATEVDGSGKCSVSYTAKDNTITKVKDLTTCERSAAVEEFSHHKKIIGVTVQSESQTTFELADDIIQSAFGTENYSTYVNIRHDLASSVQSSQSLTFVSSEDGAKALQGDSVAAAVATVEGEFIEEDLENDPVDQQCTEQCKPASEVVANVRSALTFENLAQMKSASAYLEVLEAFRGSSQETIVDVLNEEANGEILPQLLDAAGAAQTQAAFDAAMTILDFKNEGLERTLERFLVVTAFNNHPSEETFNKLWELLNTGDVANDNVKMTLALTLGMMIRTSCATEAGCQAKVVQDTFNWFLDGLKSENVETKIMCLQALKNAVQPASIDAILDLLEVEEDMTVIEVALEDLEKFDVQYFTSKVNKVLNSLYHQNRREVSIVVQKSSLTTLLGKNPSEQDVINVVLSIPHQSGLELAKYVVSKVLQMAEKDSQAGDTVRAALRNQAVGNYYNLGMDGYSTAYKNILADTVNAMVDYDINILFTGAGLLRQTNFDVLLHAAGESMMVLQVAGYSKGLESFFGEESGDEGAGAGLGCTLLDMQLRPLTFFSGAGDIMNMAWSLGSASGSTYPALQGIMLLHDHVQKISLQSGLDVDLTLHGGASVDLGGSLDFSLWDRTSTTIVYNSGAMAIKGSTKLVTPYLRTGLDFHAEASGTINFVTDLQFSSLPPLFCLQMMQEPLKYRNHINMYEQLSRSENKFQASAVRRTKVQDLSFKLMDENTPTCDQMFGGDAEEDSGSWW